MASASSALFAISSKVMEYYLGHCSLGWSDADIFDAVSYGASIVSTGLLFHAFKMSDA